MSRVGAVPAFVPAADRLLRRALIDWPSIGALSDPEVLLRRAEYHGLAGVIGDALAAKGTPVPAEFLLRDVARQIDHRTHLAALQRIDDAFCAAGIVAAPLKGPILAERYYPRPATRVSGDTDLLIDEGDVDVAQRVLGAIGYVAAEGPEEDRFRREHHHVHFSHPQAPPLELHFHAYRGFGRTLRSEGLLRRSQSYAPFKQLRVLEQPDELVYLAVHGAAHKFGRWSWLFDLRLMLDALEKNALSRARFRARETGFDRPFAFAGELLATLFGVKDTNRFGEVGRVRSRALHGLLDTPNGALLRATSRFLYSTALCADARTTARWVTSELVRRGRGSFA